MFYLLPSFVDMLEAHADDVKVFANPPSSTAPAAGASSTGGLFGTTPTSNPPAGSGIFGGGSLFGAKKPEEQAGASTDTAPKTSFFNIGGDKSSAPACGFRHSFRRLLISQIMYNFKCPLADFLAIRRQRNRPRQVGCRRHFLTFISLSCSTNNWPLWCLQRFFRR